MMKKTTAFKGFKPQKRSFFGRSAETRTPCLLVPNQALYQMSYTSKVKKTYKIVVLTELVKIVVKPLLRG